MRIPTLTVTFALVLFTKFVPADDSLPQQIDQAVAELAGELASPPADDATFLRRVYLDLLGRIPSSQETRLFLADTNPEKRRILVDDLLQRPQFAEHMAVVFDVLLMERRGGQHVKTAEFREYLRQSFAEGKSYRTLVKEILTANGTPDQNRPAAAFYLERGVTPDLLTREIGRVFFGVDLQCAQCHDHPNIDDYDQDHYYGLQAFVVRASLFQPDNKKPALISEKAEGEAAFKSVFTNRAGMSGPRVPGGTELVPVSFIPGSQYKAVPAKDVRGIPVESRLEALATTVTDQPTDAFNRNIANRLWAHMLGKGIVEPVDLHHSGNPPSNPKLLQILADGIAASDYDVKAFLRAIALSETYQRSPIVSSALPELADLSSQVEQLQAQLTQEIELASALEVKGDELVAEVDKAFTELAPFDEAITNTGKAVTEAMKARDAAQAKHQTALKAVEDAVQKQSLISEAHAKTKLATEAIKEDKELSLALDTLTKKLADYQTQIDQLKAQEQTEANALSAATTQLEAAQTAAREAIAAAMPAREKLRQLRDQLVDIRKQAAQHRTIANVAAENSEFLSSIMTYREQSARIDELQQALPGSTTALAEAQQQVPEMQMEVKATEKQVETAQATLTQTAKDVQQATETHSNALTTLELLNESLTKVSEAAARLADADDLKLAIDKISSRSKDQSSQVAATEQALMMQQKLHADAQQALAQKQTNLKAMQQKLQSHEQQVVALANVLKQQQTELQETEQSRSTLWNQIVSNSARLGKTSEITGLTAEQLGWSVLIASGQHQRQIDAETAKLNKEKPLAEAAQNDPQQLAERNALIERTAREASQKNVDKFVSLFSAASGQPQGDFFATADQALFFANGSELRSWLSPGGGNLTDRLRQLEDPQAIAEELYISVLCRPASAEETQVVQAYLAERKEARSEAVQELAWALMTSSEFRFRY